MKRAYVYDRVSSAKQALGYSLPTQNAACRAFCAQRGYSVVAEYEDAHTGTTHERPGLDALLDALASDPVDVVIAYDLDRLLGRDELGQVLLKHAILDAGARIEYVMGGSHDHETSDGELLVGFKALIARLENTQRTERVKRGQRGRISAGFPLAGGVGTPYGYTYVSSPHQGELVINQIEANVVRSMFHWLNIEGLSCYAIAQRLHAEGIPTRGDGRRAAGEKVKKFAGECVWDPGTISKMLGSPLYRGEYTYGTTKRVKRASMTKPDGSRYASRYRQVPTDPDQWLTIAIPAIVDTVTWERAQERLDENKRFARPAKHEYLLRGMLVCPSCGMRFVGSATSREYIYYRCQGTATQQWRPACALGFQLRRDAVDATVWEYVVGELLNPERLVEQIEERQRGESGRREVAERQLRAVELELARIDRLLASLLDQVLGCRDSAAILEGFPASVVDAKKRELLDTRTRMEKEQTRMQRALAATTLVGPRAIETLRELAGIVREAAGAMTFEERRQLLRLLEIEVDVLDRETLRVRGLVRSEVLGTSLKSCPQYPQFDLPFATTLALAQVA